MITFSLARTKTVGWFSVTTGWLSVVVTLASSAWCVAGAPPGWVQYAGNGHFYRMTTGNTSWEDAEAQAVAFGGHLASIADVNENNFIQQNFAPVNNGFNGFWLGGTDDGHQGTWTWSDGEPWVYTNWDVGEPNGGAVENWLIMYNDLASNPAGKWNDLSNGPAIWRTGVIETAQVPTVPAASGWGMIVLTLLLTAAGASVLWRAPRRGVGRPAHE